MSTQEAATTELVPYKWIEEQLRTKVQDGSWLAGAKLPSRRDLAAEYGVAVGTVQRAVSSLLSEGILSSEGPRGTFVSVQTSKNTAERIVTPLGVHITVGVIAGLEYFENGQGATNTSVEVVTNSVERSITRAGATSRFFSLCRPDKSIVTVEWAVEALLAEGVDAIVVVLELGQTTRAAALAEARQTPLIFIAEGKSSQAVLSVYYDSYDAGYQAAQHLLERGCSDLLFFAPYTCQWVQERLLGARQAAKALGLPATALHSSIAPEILEQAKLEDGSHKKAGYRAARTLLAGGLPAHGVIAANDSVALGFLQAASELGLTAGRDYALIGFDDLPEAREAGLTSLHPPLEALGQEAGRLVLRALNGQSEPVQVCLHSHLVARSSSRFSHTPARPDNDFRPSLTYLTSTHERGISNDHHALSSII